MQKLLFTGGLIAALAFPTAALAAPDHDGHRGKGHHRGHGMEKVFDKLDLTADQKSRIQAIRNQHKQAAKADHEALKAKRQALAQLMRAENATQAQALALHREVQALKNRLSEARLASWFEVREVLTPAQRKQLAEMKHHGHKRHKGRD